MSRLPSFLIAAGAVTATVLLIVRNNHHLGSDRARPVDSMDSGAATPALPVPATSSAPSPPPPPPAVPATSAWFSLETDRGLTLVLRGVLSDPESRAAVLDQVSRAAPELFTVKDEITVDPAADRPSWLDPLPDLAGRLAGSVQDPDLHLGPDLARIGGTSDREEDLDFLRDRFSPLAAGSDRREDRLRLDPSRPARDTRMPLVLYLAVVEGVYRFEGSLPSHGLVRATSEAASASAGEDRFSGNLRVSGRTVDEPWMASLPALVAALLEGKREGMELIVVDRTLTLKGEVPDEPTKEKLLELAKPAREAGYAVKDELTVNK